MARTIRTTEPIDDYPVELTEAEARQAEVGTLFAIQGPEFEDVSWSIHRYRNRHEIALDPNGKPEAWVADVSGELKGSELVELLGGGTFHFYGHVPKETGGVRIKYNRVVTLEGPRKNFNEAPSTNGVAVSNGSHDSELVRGLRAQLNHERRERARAEEKRALDERFARLEQMIAASHRNETPTKMSEIVALMSAIDQMRKSGVDSGSEIEKLQILMNTFRQGLELGQERDPIPVGESDPNAWAPLVKQFLGVADQFLSRMPRRGPMGAPPPGAQRPNPGAPTPAAPVSEATVIETPAASTNDPSTQLPHRWKAAIDSLYRKMMTDGDPRDVAIALEVMLDSEEVAGLRGMSGEQAMIELKPLLAAYPALEGDQGRVYITAVLDELREMAREEEAEETAAK